MVNKPAIIVPLSLFGGLAFYPLLCFAIYSKNTTAISVCLSLIVASRFFSRRYARKMDTN